MGESEGKSPAPATSGKAELDSKVPEDAPERSTGGTGMDRVVHRGDGPYYIAPDSAEPWPAEIWDRVDIDVLETSMRDAQAREQGASESDRVRYTTKSGFFVNEDDRAVLKSLGMPLDDVLSSGVDDSE